MQAEKLHRRWMDDPEYRSEYEWLDGEFSLARVIIGARTLADLTQAELASRMHTTVAVVARLESGRVTPSFRMLERLAEATGLRLRISFEPTRTPT